MRLRARLLILFLACWLPVSVAVAAGMALSMSGPAQQAVAEEGEGCPQHAPKESKDRSPGDCYSCSFCQFACTALMSVSTPAMQVCRGWVAIEFSAPPHPRASSEPLQRPPLAF